MSRAATRSSPEQATAPPAAGAPKPLLPEKVPRPADGRAVVELGPLAAGGLAAERAEWGPDGGAVVLTGNAPFARITGRAGLRADGSLDGVVRMRARVLFLGLELGELAWTVDAWSPGVPLAAPAVTLRGEELVVDLTTLPKGAVWTASTGADAPLVNGLAVVELPREAVSPDIPLGPRVAEVYRGLGLDVSGLRVHPDTPVVGVPAFVTDQDLFFAPGIHGADAPEALKVLDTAVWAALAGLFGAVSGEPAPVVPSAPTTADAPATETSAVSATVPPTVAEPVEETVSEPVPTVEEATPETETPSEAATLAETGAMPEAEAASTPAVELIMPEPPTTLTPAAASRGAAVAGDAATAGSAARALPSADADIAGARAAVTEPPAETAAKAREELAAELGGQPAPSLEIVELCERIRTAIRSNRPEDEDQLLKTDPTKEAQKAGATVTGSVDSQAKEVAGSYDAMAAPPSGSPAPAPAPIQAPPTASPGPGVEAATAAPDPIPPESTTLNADVAATDQKIAGSGIDTPVTKQIPDGPFAEARAARAGLGETAQRAPRRIQDEQQQAIDSAQADMAELQRQAIAAMRAARSDTVASVGEGQTRAVASEEKTRESVAHHAQRLYDEAQKKVDALLKPLSRTAITRWEAGLARLSQEFHDSLDAVKRWIDERHSGLGGAILAVGDYIGGLPPEVKKTYDCAERMFGDGVCDLLLSISTDINGVILAARAIVERAGDDINAAFEAMAAEFPEWAAREKARFGGMLDGLGQRVTDVQSGFIRDVSQRALTAVNQVHSEVQTLREEAGGLIGRVAAAIEEFTDDPVRATVNGLLRLIGIPPADFWALVEKIGQVTSDLAADPERFANNLAAAVRRGFQQFFDNFGKHLLAGFWGWLFSGLKTPVPLPADLSVKSLFAFSLQLMGITWPRVREILVRHVGPTAVEVVEEIWKLVSVLVERGPQGLADLVKEQLAPENLVTMILDAAIGFLTETLVKQVVVRVLGLFNPVGAVVQAIDLIYQLCAWIFRNAARVFRFVEAIANGLADIIAGNVAGLATSIEKALASLLPPVIDFLAGLLHLGGIPSEVADVIIRLQAFVYTAMDRTIGFLAERGKALLARAGLGGKKEGGPDAEDELGKSVRFTAADESHRLFVQREGGRGELMVASTPTAVPDMIRKWRTKLNAEPADEEKRAKAETLFGALETAVKAVDAEVQALIKILDETKDDPAKTVKPTGGDLSAGERSVAKILKDLFELFGENDRAKHLADIEKALPRAGGEHAEEVLTDWKKEYIDVWKAKPLDGGNPKVWDSASFVARDLLPSEVLASEANHAKLLKYFDERPNASAGTPQFREYALNHTLGDHDVREQFLGAFGSRVAAKLRFDVSQRIKDHGDSELPTELSGVGFRLSGSRFGTFQPRPSFEASVLLHGLLIPTGLMATLRTLLNGDPVGGVRIEELLAELRRSQKARTFMAGQVRNVKKGYHEWLPVSIAADVLQHAFDLGKVSNLRDALGWVTLLEHLRSPANGLIWKIVSDPVIAPGEKPQEGPKVHAQGHVTALSRDRYKVVQNGLTVGTGKFHDALRNFFHENKSMPPAAWVDALLEHLPNIMWTGKDLPLPSELSHRPLNAYYRLPSGLYAPDMTVALVQEDVQERWEKQIVAAFKAAKAAIE